MKLLTRTLPRAAVVLIAFWILHAIISRLIPLEFVYSNDEVFFEMFRFWSLPIAILLTLFGTIKSLDKAGLVASKVFVTLLAFTFSVFILFVSAFSGMCQWVSTETLFTRSNCESDKIVLREFGCGATDSGEPRFGVFRARNVTSHFVWITEIDTATLDKKVWTRANRNLTSVLRDINAAHRKTE